MTGAEHIQGIFFLVITLIPLGALGWITVAFFMAWLRESEGR